MELSAGKGKGDECGRRSGKWGWVGTQNWLTPGWWPPSGPAHRAVSQVCGLCLLETGPLALLEVALVPAWEGHWPRGPPPSPPAPRCLGLHLPLVSWGRGHSMLPLSEQPSQRLRTRHQGSRFTTCILSTLSLGPPRSPGGWHRGIPFPGGPGRKQVQTDDFICPNSQR